jgi:O-antigen/teichoic acid export membrane protein
MQRAIGLLLLPLYARILTTAEYGQIGLMITIMAAAGTVMGLGLETAVFRSYVLLEGRAGDLQRFVNTVGLFAIAAPLVVAVAADFAFSSIVVEAFGVPRLAVATGFVGIALMTSTSVLPLAVIRAQERLRDYLRLTFVQAVLTVGLTVIFVAMLGWAVIGWMLAIAVSAAATLVGGVRVLRHRWTLEVDVRHLRAALLFGIPLVPHALAHWGLSLSDRLVLGYFVSPDDIGVYYAAYQFALPVSVLAISASQAMQPLFARASVDKGAHEDLGRAATLQALVALAAGMLIAVMGPPLVVALLPEAYTAAADLVPWMAIGYTMFALYFIPMNAITVLSGRTTWIWVVTVVAATMNIVLNLARVPELGVEAAAMNTAVGYAILLAGVSMYAYRVLDRPIRIDWAHLGLAAALAAASVVVATLVTADAIVLQIVIRGVIAAVAIVGFALLGLANVPMIARRPEESRNR